MNSLFKIDPNIPVPLPHPMTTKAHAMAATIIDCSQLVEYAAIAEYARHLMDSTTPQPALVRSFELALHATVPRAYFQVIYGLSEDEKADFNDLIAQHLYVILAEGGVG